ncbi:MAG: hypothetical protein KDB03_14140 [Planctomycetales bacterium]|nr:hypothetical protein [Planctomycetales bacterium]
MRGKCPRLLNPILWAAWPLFLCVGVIVFWQVQQVLAKYQIPKLVEQLRAQRKFFEPMEYTRERDSVSSADTLSWNRVASMIDSHQLAVWFPPKDSPLPQIIRALPPQAASYLASMEPVLLELHRLSPEATATWRPTCSDSIWNYWDLNLEVAAMQLLRMEVFAASKAGDSLRVWNAVESMHGVWLIADPSRCETVAQLLEHLTGGVMTAVEHSGLTETQLREVLQWLDQPNWKAIGLDWLEQNQGNLLANPSRDYGTLPSVWASGLKTALGSHATFAEHLDELLSTGKMPGAQELTSFELYQNYSLQGDHILPQIERLEDGRRWARAAVGLRLYREIHGTWPEKLTDLCALGIPANELSTCRAGAIGYRVDGEYADLWINPKGTSQVPEANFHVASIALQ